MKPRLTSTLIGVFMVALTAWFSFNYIPDKHVVLEYLTILTIHDSESYSQAKHNLQNYLTSDLYSATFSSLEYEGIDLREPVVLIESIKADTRDASVHYFKVKLRLIYLNSVSKTATLIITVTDGRVSRTESI